jgi:protein involved in polysaccharide export with SLBB domain
LARWQTTLAALSLASAMLPAAAQSSYGYSNDYQQGQQQGPQQPSDTSNGMSSLPSRPMGMGGAANPASGPVGPYQLGSPTPPSFAPQYPSANFGTQSNGSFYKPGMLVPYQQGEFESFVQQLAGPSVFIQRFGASLMTPPDPNGGLGQVAEVNPLVPPDYLVKPGDEVVVTIWGGVDADFRTLVDRSGRITIPRVGPVLVSGVRYADLPQAISRRVGLVFRNFHVSVSLGQLRGIRVYVTGFVQKPGAYDVSSLSTVLQAVMRAGGPSAAGSYRDIELRRGGQLISTFDLYDFLLKGDRSSDRLLEPADVIQVAAVGRQVGVIGSVNRPAVYELRPTDKVEDAIQMAGGFTSVADTRQVSLQRLADRNNGHVTELKLPDADTLALADGDVLQAFSVVSLAEPIQRQNKRISVDGEVQRPGVYLLPPGSTISDAIKAAGGLTPAAYLFGSEFTRESVRLWQSTQYDRALRDMETDFAKAALTRQTATTTASSQQNPEATASEQLIARLREVRPTGRIVLELQPSSRNLPDLVLEDGDHLHIPPIPNTIAVFGSVYNGGSYLFSPERDVEDYLALAGGPKGGADESSIFVIRANGSVVSAQQHTGWFGLGSKLSGVPAEPGDTIFVPEEMDKTTFAQDFKDWTQILYQIGLSLAAVHTLKN